MNLEVMRSGNDQDLQLLIEHRITLAIIDRTWEGIWGPSASVKILRNSKARA